MNKRSIHNTPISYFAFFISADGTGQKQSLFKRLYTWFCGFETAEQEVLSIEQEKEREEDQMAKIHQTKRDKIILNIGLFVIFTIGTFLYCFWA